MRWRARGAGGSALGGAAWVVAQQVLILGAELPHYRGNLKRKISDIRGAGEHGALAEVQSAAKEVMGELQKEQAGWERLAGAIAVVLKTA